MMLEILVMFYEEFIQKFDSLLFERGPKTLVTTLVDSQKL